MDCGNFVDAKPLCELTLENWQKTAGNHNAGTLAAMNDLALACQRLGDLKRAQSLFEHALATRKAVLGPIMMTRW